MTDKHRDDITLDMFFDAARETAPAPSVTLMERVLADARTALPPTAASVSRRGSFRWPEWLQGLAVSWPELAGMAAAAVAGLWIGYRAPEGINTALAALWPSDTASYQMADFIPGFDGMLAEDGI